MQQTFIELPAGKGKARVSSRSLEAAMLSMAGMEKRAEGLGQNLAAWTFGATFWPVFVDAFFERVKGKSFFGKIDRTMFVTALATAAAIGAIAHEIEQQEEQAPAAPANSLAVN